MARRIKSSVFALAVIVVAACEKRPPIQKPLDTEAAETAKGYTIEWVFARVPATMAVGSTETATVSLRNVSNRTLEAGLALSYHWYSAGDRSEPVLWDGVRTALGLAVKPAETHSVIMNIVAPDAPGEYDCVIDVVHEGVAWFSKEGAPTSDHRVSVK